MAFFLNAKIIILPWPPTIFVSLQVNVMFCVILSFTCNEAHLAGFYATPVILAPSSIANGAFPLVSPGQGRRRQRRPGA